MSNSSRFLRLRPPLSLLPLSVLPSYHWFRCVILMTTLVLTAGGVSFAEGPGQADFDEAVAKKLSAKSAADLEQVIDLLESALTKGLDETDSAFAKEMLGAASLQRGQELARRLLSAGNNPVAMNRVRATALESLEKAVTNDPKLTDAYLLIARLNVLPGGNRKRAIEAATSAVDALEGKPKELSEALLLRSLLREDPVQRRADLDRAIELAPDNVQAWQARASHLLQTGETEGAVADLKKLIESQPDNVVWVKTAAEVLFNLQRADEAMEVIGKGIERFKDGSLYRMRAVIRQQQDKDEEALADLDEAIKLDEKDAASRLMRAEMLLQKDDVSGAKRDVEAAMNDQPNSLQGVLMRSLIAAQEGRLQDAINDMKLLVRFAPDNAAFALQLASYYQMDNRPRQCIETLNPIISADGDNWRALRLRGDARLSIGAHQEAIADYKEAVKHVKDDEDGSGVLNNLAWVLATSPEDSIRDGAAALEFAKQAAEKSEYKQAHILSTLAAAYAESGNFDEARKWAEKAVEVGKAEENEQVDQLQQELESYKKNEPWREKQETKENKAPLVQPKDIIDT